MSDADTPEASPGREEPDPARDKAPEQARVVEAEELVAFARDLEAEAPRQRRAPVRRRGRVIHEGEVLDDEWGEPVRVRSESEEPSGRDPDEQESDEHRAGMLDASGAPIDGGASVGQGVSGGGAVGEGAAGEAPAAPVASPGPGPAAPRGATSAPDAAAFLALAVQTYLDGVDRCGAESEVTRDRLTQLRATLALYQGRSG